MLEEIFDFVIIVLLAVLILVGSGFVIYSYFDYDVSNVNGDSMEPNYQHCDLVFYSSESNISINSPVIIEIEENKYIKRVYDIEKNYIPENSNYIVEDNVFIYDNDNFLFEHRTNQNSSEDLRGEDIVITFSDNERIEGVHPYIIDKSKIKKVNFKINREFNIFC